jgi:16S rRNA (uracil1498-N3)-methyltransferase
MRQFILPEDWDGGATCIIEGGRAHYLARVLRLGPSSSFPGRDSIGRPWTCSVLESGPDRILLAIAPPLTGEAELELQLRNGPRIFLVQGLLKGTKMDMVVRQATEAGVSAIFPLLAARSVVQGAAHGALKDGEGSGPRLARWRRIIREALQQSGSEWRTQLAEPLGLAELPAAMAAHGIFPSNPKILFHESPLAQSSMHGYLTGAPEAVVLCVGPEGGFAPEEVDFFLDEGFKPLRLAGAVLRAETAAIYAIASAQIVLSERSSWIPKPS